MSARLSNRRLVALLLLLVLPAIAGARLSLDLRANPAASDGIEPQHRVGCSLSHDHSVCALLIRSPGSPGPTSPSIAPLLPPFTQGPLAAATPVPEAERLAATARAPPFSV